MANNSSQKKHATARSKPSLRQKLAHLLLRIPSHLIPLAEQLSKAAVNGIIDRQAQRMIQGVIQVSSLQVRDIMIPRAQMVSLSQQATIAEILPIIIDSAHSRFPVQAKNSDSIAGILLAKDLLPCLLQPQNLNQTIEHLIRPAGFIPESKQLDILLEEFRNNHNHMAIVVDEYGGVAGLVTIEDVLEEIVGEIEDEYDNNPTVFLKKINKFTYEAHALTPLKSIDKKFNTHLSGQQVDTIGGLINRNLGRMAKRGEQIKLDKLQIKVLSVDARFIKKVQIKLKPE